jgi:type I restriction enzyme S subunit
VPEGWSAVPIKRIGRLKGGAGFPDQYQGIDGEELSFHKVNAIGQADRKGFLLPSNNTISPSNAKALGAFVFPPESIVFAKVGAALLLGRIRVLNHHACIDNNMMGLVVHTEDRNIDFVKYAMTLVRFDLIANPGAVPSLNEGQIGNFRLPLPPLAEQTHIAEFLDRETGKIDELVAEQQRLMELLKEKRQAVISHAVTKGLNPRAPMKPSGIEWFGDVPAHWHVGKKLKTFAKRQPAAFTNGPFGSDLLTSELQDEGVPVVYIRDLKTSGYSRTSTSYVTQEKAAQLDKFRVDPGDVLIAKVGDPPGFCCAYPDGERPGIVCQDVIRMKPNHEQVVSDYLCYLLNSPSGIESIDSICVELTRKRFSLEDLHALRIPIPPRKEQQEIAEVLKAETAKFDALASEAQKAIDLLQERRTALISAAVTGQIDVRKLAAA